MELLTGKIVCVTGSSRGIGRACAVASAKHGASGLILHYLGDHETETEFLSLKQEIEAVYMHSRVAGIPGDIADAETAHQVGRQSTMTIVSVTPSGTQKIVKIGIEAFGRIDVLVTNAGICPFAEFLTLPFETWERTRQVNVDGSFFVVQAVSNQMKMQTPQGGSIIAMSSVSALVGGEFQCHYTPTKAAILSLMQSCAIALGKYNIRCNAILPGTIATDINKEDLSNPEKRKYMIKRTPLGRIGLPDDVAGPMVFLASDLAKYVTGAQLLVDGGLFVNLQ